MSIVTNVNLQKLYQSDDYQWLLKTIDLLKQNRFQELDLDNLIEELEDLGSEKRNTVKSLLEQVIRHLLLLQYWTEESERNRHHWRSELVTFRHQLEDRLTTNLTNYLTQEKSKIYQRALRYVREKTKFQVYFPEECPYSLTHLLDLDYLD